MALNPNISKDKNGVHWLNWTPDPSAEGYAFVTPGGQSRTFDPKKGKTKLGKCAEPVLASVAALDVTSRPQERATYPTTSLPPILINDLARAAKRVVFCAQRSEEALNSPRDMPVALTADPSYAAWATPEIVAAFRAQGRRIYSWGVQTQIPASMITGLRDRLGLDGAIFQSETSEEYRTAIEAGTSITVGNPNSWSDAQRVDANKRIAAGTLAVIGECYTNLGGPWPNQYSAGGVNICSVCLGVYDGSRETAGGWNPSVASYKDNCSAAMFRDAGVYHAAGVNQAEWSLFA
jgi:hypothetical protein